MRFRADRPTLVAAVALLALAPALAQQTPESILPPGFGQPEPASNEQTPPNESAAGSPGVDSVEPDSSTTAVAEDVDAGEAGNETAPQMAPVDLPPEELRGTEQVGALDETNGGVAANGFGDSNGRYLTTLMARLDAPLASRWASILLRRVLLSRTTTPAGIAPGDWIGERALLLARLGNADDARNLVQAIDVPNYTVRTYDAAMQAALASADPAALCGLVEGAASRMPSWSLARGICAGLGGDSSSAGATLDEVRRQGRAGGIDVRLAEKVAAVGGNARRAITAEWDGVEGLNAWRYGMAAATAVPIPPRLLGTVGPQVQAWLARAPLYAAADRLMAAERAAALGVFSAAALIDLYGQVYDETDVDERGDSAAERVRDIYQGPVNQRVAAMDRLWTAGEAEWQRYARLILTSRAAGLLPVDEGVSGDRLDRLVGSMLAAGLDEQAARWSDRAEEGSEAWALLALGSPQHAPVVGDTAEGFGTGNQAQLLLAGLAGLGRLEGDAAANLGITTARRTRWAAALEQATVAGQRGTVVLLCAVGLQTPDWRAVPAAHLYRIVDSLRRAGFEPEARMIAAEAIMRT